MHVKAEVERLGQKLTRALRKLRMQLKVLKRPWILLRPFLPLLFAPQEALRFGQVYAALLCLMLMQFLLWVAMKVVGNNQLSTMSSPLPLIASPTPQSYSATCMLGQKSQKRNLNLRFFFGI